MSAFHVIQSSPGMYGTICTFIEMPRAVPRPLPYASQTSLYDDHWMAKQQKGRVDFQTSTTWLYLLCTYTYVHVGFVRWLNHILTPVDEYGQVMPRLEGAGELQCIIIHVVCSVLLTNCHTSLANLVL